MAFCNIAGENVTKIKLRDVWGDCDGPEVDLRPTVYTLTPRHREKPDEPNLSQNNPIKKGNDHE